MIWISIIIIAIVYFGWLFWEIRNAPLMPDDYDTEEEFKNKNKIKNQMKDNKYRPLPDGLYIGISEIEGNGLFTTRELKEGEELGITHIRYNSEDFHSHYIRTPLGGFMNHQTTPNCVLYECGAYLKLKVEQTINPGDELTLAYNLYDPCKNYMDTNK